MRKILAIGLLVAGWLSIGCDRLPPAPVSKNPPKIGPHQVVAFPLADEKGYVEFLNEPAVEERGSTTPTSIVVYFLDKEAKASLEPPPTDVKFLLNLGQKGTRLVDMKSEPKSGDPAGGCRFASSPGPYRIDDLRGDLTATLGGSPVKISLVGSR